MEDTASAGGSTAVSPATDSAVRADSGVEVFPVADSRSMKRLEVSHDGSYILLVIFLCE